jgi:hypothetical protein
MAEDEMLEPLGVSHRGGGHGSLNDDAVDPGFYSVVAEKNGNVVGSNFLDEHGPIARRAAG